MPSVVVGAGASVRGLSPSSVFGRAPFVSGTEIVFREPFCSTPSHPSGVRPRRLITVTRDSYSHQGSTNHGLGPHEVPSLYNDPPLLNLFPLLILLPESLPTNPVLPTQVSVLQMGQILSRPGPPSVERGRLFRGRSAVL